MVQTEENIENNILEWLEVNGVNCEKKITKGFFNEKKWFYQKNKSRFAKRGSSDIHGTIPPYGRGLYIEVKKPSEMNFFDRPGHVLRDELHRVTYEFKSKTPEAQKQLIKKYTHAVEQSEYIEEKIKAGAVAFFASSINQCINRLKDFWIEIE